MNALVDRLKNETSLIVRNLRGRLGGLAGDERGVSAVEFAMLLPLMLSLISARSRSRRPSAPIAR